MNEFSKFLNKYCIVRTRSAGVFAGEVTALDKDSCTIKNSRRIWYWDGAASLSQLSQEGVKRPENCKFPCVIPEHLVFEPVEIIPCTPDARQSIEGVEIWQE